MRCVLVSLTELAVDCDTYVEIRIEDQASMIIHQTVLLRGWNPAASLTCQLEVKGQLVKATHAIHFVPRCVPTKNTRTRSNRFRAPQTLSTRGPDHSCPPRGGLMQGWKSELGWDAFN